MKGMRILLTNDDGFGAPGLSALADALGDLGEIFISAPAHPMSAASRSLTLHNPVRIRPMGERAWAVEGTPSDSVIAALRRFVVPAPDIVVSGINSGPNLSDDIAYSGTVGAALEAARLGIPALALSLASGNATDFSHAAALAARMVPLLVASPPGEGIAVSVNIPPGTPKGIRLTRPGRRRYPEEIIERTDPFGCPYYWLAGSGGLGGDGGPETDIAAIADGYVSVTPLVFDPFAADARMRMEGLLEKME